MKIFVIVFIIFLVSATFMAAKIYLHPDERPYFDKYCASYIPVNVSCAANNTMLYKFLCCERQWKVINIP